ncbi:hypothetical protein RFI_12520 [Reticulomyxa filosa]|uniref:G-protein coupled receptors family 1 profile domain-containing protein n=1 Tax=Reticulomyxa filosa TaxID=46433 RepID=X6NH03_RETFI|nr:hypothetical protein RFI_12520 [Reticulomyxa filosa]|eukprot:ETO24637.1 hypothetical protein RFI_12520 [Reticulomyxa filosa]
MKSEICSNDVSQSHAFTKYLGTLLSVNVFLFPFQTLLCVYSLYHLIRLQKQASKLLVYSAILYHVFAWIYNAQTAISYSVGLKYMWTLHWSGFCVLTKLNDFLSPVLFYAMGIVFWKKKKKAYFFAPFQYSFFFIKKKKKKTYTQKIVAVFEPSTLRISKLKIVIFYVLLALLITFTVCCAVLISVGHSCVFEVQSGDFDPYGEKVYYGCSRNGFLTMLLTFSGAVLIFVFNTVIAWMYLSRLVGISRALDPFNSVSQTISTDKKGQTSDITSKVEANEYAPSSYTSRFEIEQIRKSSLIAVTSILGSFVMLVIIAIWSNLGFLMLFDGFANGVFISCSFAFGNSIYSVVFGCCDRVFRPSDRRSTVELFHRAASATSSA